MFDKISKIYEDSTKKKLFAQNEQVYTNFLGKQFTGFKADNDDSYYSKIFETLIGYTTGNEKIFSQIKHLCYELSGHQTKAGETIHKIVAAMESYLTNQAAVYKKINFEPSENVNLMNKKLLCGLSEWGSQLLIQKKFVIDNMAGFFHYKKHEYSELGNLISLQAEVQNNFKKKAQVLEQTKLKLFASKNVDKWKINYTLLKGDINTMMKKYETIKDFMLPEVILSGNKGDQRLVCCCFLLEKTYAF